MSSELADRPLRFWPLRFWPLKSASPLATVPSRGARRGTSGRWERFLTTDFCPGLNRYVYWLKEPIGWFAIALFCSVLIGMFVSPIGWVLASMIGGVIAAGVAWPWLAVRAADCSLAPVVGAIEEGDRCDLKLLVRNRSPFPLWGLAVEGYLDREGDDAAPTLALACVPMWSDAEYRIGVQPELRGRYPLVRPQIACSMPLGIWTARRAVRESLPLTVHPKVSRVTDEPELAGVTAADAGDGQRPGQCGEPIGLREFRGGDRLRHVNWVQTARSGVMTVSERGGPQRQAVELVLDPSAPSTWHPDDQPRVREAIKRRVRVAASLAIGLHGRHVPLRVSIGQRTQPIPCGATGRERLLDLFTDVPADGTAPENAASEAITTPQRRIRPDALTVLVEGDGNDELSGDVTVRIIHGAAGSGKAAGAVGSAKAAGAVASAQTARANRAATGATIRIAADECLDRALARFWWEVSRAASAA